MSESWKNRLWQLVLVCTFAVVLSVCNKAMDSSSDGSSSSSSGIAYADFKPSDVSAVMFCRSSSNSSGINKFKNCDSSDSTSIDSSDTYSITLDSLVDSGFRPCGMAGQGTSDSMVHFLFCK